jgi:F0F1-type ATP synthase membrane subunit b/b'
MTPRRSFLVALLLLLIILPAVLAAAPAEEGGEHSATLDFVGKLVNFLLLFGGLTVALWKPVKAMLAQRTKTVGDSIFQAGTGRAEAEERAFESKAKLAGLAAEIERLKAEAEEAGRKEAERIAQAAAAEAERLKKLTRQELDEQVRRGVGELKAYAAEKATALARERIRARMTPSLQSALIDRSIDRLSKLHEESGPR